MDNPIDLAYFSVLVMLLAWSLPVVVLLLRGHHDDARLIPRRCFESDEKYIEYMKEKRCE